MTKKISVTAADIALGERQSICDCPIARATRRAFRARRHRKVVVRHEGIFVGDLDDGGDTFWVGTLPPDARHFIRRFDDKRPVTPCVFTVIFR